MRLNIEVNHKFHSVGQGLFASGNIHLGSCSVPDFVWVYDCGTTSSQQYVINALRFSGLESGVDLVTISHFDKDHISGMVNLLKIAPVQDLLLPFMPLWQRLVLIIEEGVTLSDELGRFLIDPVRFISEIPNVRVKRVLFVSPGGGLQETDGNISPENGSPLPELRLQKQERRGPREEDNLGPGKLSASVDIIAESSMPADDERRRYKEEASGISNIDIQFMFEGSAITVSGYWEFMPYNDGELAGRPGKSFRTKVEILRSILLSSPVLVDREVALYDLKKIYVKTFGKSPQERNVISLFLYAGPLGESALLDSNFAYGERDDYSVKYMHWNSYLLNFARGAILYTGDGYLDNRQRFTSLSEYLGGERLSKVSVLQVMHHGSRHNWMPGVAERISPEFSVFSSDPSHRGYRHPHAEVLRDFWSFGPIQVDKENAVEFNMVHHLSL